MGREDHGPIDVKYVEPFKGVRLEERGGKIIMMTWLERAPWLCVAEFKRENIYSPLREVRTSHGYFCPGGMLIVLTVFLTTNYLFSRLETKRRSICFLDVSFTTPAGWPLP